MFMNMFKKMALLLIIFALTLSQVNYSYAEPRQILSAWTDVEVFDIDSISVLANPDAPKGGSITLTTTGTYDNYHVFAQRGRATHYFMYTYESLGESLPGVPSVIRGLLAESFDLSEDRTILKVKLNPLAKFADGSKVTAQDVVFTFNAQQTDANPLYTIGYQDVLSVVAESESTVVFTFVKNANRELPLEVCQLPVFSEKWWEGRDFSEPQTEPILASGAYQVKSADFGVRFTLERDPNYWAKDLPRNRGKNNFDEIIVDYYRDTTIAREAFFAGDADFFSEGTIKDWINAYDVPAVKDGRITKLQYERTTPIGMMGLAMNTRTPILSDKNVRRALILMMDFETINNSIYYGTYKRIDSYFTGHGLDIPSRPSKEELAILNEYKDQLDPIVFEDLPIIPVTNGDGNMRKQMGEAVEILKQSGWELKNGKMVDKDGNQMILRFATNSQTVQRTYAQYVHSLSRIGIDLQVQLLDQNLYSAELNKFDFDMIYHFIPLYYYPANELPYYFGSESATLEGSRNYVGISNPVLDDLIERIISSQSQKEIILYQKIMDRILQHEMYYVPSWYSPYSRVAWWNTKITPGSDANMGIIPSILYWHEVE